MKKKLTAFLFIVAALLLSVMPVYANAPAPDPSAVTLTITHPELLSKVRMILYDENGQAVKRYITIVEQSRERTWICDGLTTDDKLVIH